MLNLRRVTIEVFVEELKNAYLRTYSDWEKEHVNIITWAGRLALENIANSDALYHNVEHTVMVTLAGQSILEGKHLCEGGVTPNDWMHFVLALLCHDIGYVKGICIRDENNRCSSGKDQKMIEIPEGSTDVALTPYHVDRSKQFVIERFTNSLSGDDGEPKIDADLIASYIEMTRFPVPEGEEYQDTHTFGGLVRAADFIGQLGDPDYHRKIPALYYEMEEVRGDQNPGYTSPGQMREAYAGFFWNVVSAYIKDAIHYLQVTQEGKQWIANLYAHVFASEHYADL